MVTKERRAYKENFVILIGKIKVSQGYSPTPLYPERIKGGDVF